MKHALRGFLLAAVLAALLAPQRLQVEAAPAAGVRVFNFDKDAVGKMPAGFEAHSTQLGAAPRAPGSWRVAADGKNRVLEGRGVAGVYTDTSYLVLKGSSIADCELSARVRLMSTGLKDGHIWAGLVARYTGSANFYGVQMDWEREERIAEIMYTLEDVNKEIFEKDTEKPFKYPTPWHTLRMRLEGPMLTFWFDDDKVFEGRHGLFAKGQVGLFVSDSSVVQFDDFKITEIPGKAPVSTASGKTTAGWQHETVLTSTTVFPQAAITVDASSVPHLATFDNQKGTYEHRWRKDAKWQMAVIDDGKSFNAKYSNPRQPPQQLLALKSDVEGNLHLLYARSPENAKEVKYARSLGYAMRKGDAWSVTALEFDNANAWYPALSFDQEWMPQALYFDIHSNKVEHAWKSADGKWQLETAAVLEGETGRGSHFRLGGVVGDRNLVQAAYPDENRNSLVVAVGRNGKYDVTYLTEKGRDLGAFPAAARDSRGIMHVSSQEAVKQNLAHTTMSGGKWVTTIVDDKRGTGIMSSIVVDGRDLPRIAYLDVTTGTIRYAMFNGKTWQIEDTGLAGIYPQLSLDAKGFPHLVYYDQKSDTLRYATKDEAKDGGPPAR